MSSCASRELLGERVAELGVEPPEPVARRSARSGSPRPSTSIEPSQRKKIGSSCVRVARSRRRRPSFGPACVRSCGRTTRFSYGSTRSAATKPSRRARDAVGPDVVLREPPVRRLRLLDEHARRRASRRGRAAACSSESGSVRWTTLYGLARRYSSRCSSEMTSYGGATRLGERPGIVVVAERAERADRRPSALTVPA